MGMTQSIFGIQCTASHVDEDADVIFTRGRDSTGSTDDRCCHKCGWGMIIDDIDCKRCGAENLIAAETFPANIRKIANRQERSIFLCSRQATTRSIMTNNERMGNIIDFGGKVSSPPARIPLSQISSNSTSPRTDEHTDNDDEPLGKTKSTPDLVNMPELDHASLSNTSPPLLPEWSLSWMPNSAKSAPDVSVYGSRGITPQDTPMGRKTKNMVSFDNWEFAHLFKDTRPEYLSDSLKNESITAVLTPTRRLSSLHKKNSEIDSYNDFLNFPLRSTSTTIHNSSPNTVNNSPTENEDGVEVGELNQGTLEIVLSNTYTSGLCSPVLKKKNVRQESEWSMMPSAFSDDSRPSRERVVVRHLLTRGELDGSVVEDESAALEERSATVKISEFSPTVNESGVDEFLAPPSNVTKPEEKYRVMSFEESGVEEYPQMTTNSG